MMKKISLVLLLFIFSASSPNDARKANEAFERGDFEEAVEYYRQAINQNPDHAELHFNLGNALYELGRTEEAREAYERYKTLANSPVNQSFADYNTGKILADEEKYDEALDYFREALKKNPDDDDARHNYELALRKQQEQEQQQEQQEQQPESGDEEQEQDQQQQQDQNREGDQNQDQDQSPQPDPSQQPDDPGNEQGEQEIPMDMSREEAENILDALRQLERDLLENRKKESSESERRNEQDW